MPFYLKTDRVQDSHEEQEFWMTRLDWVGIRLNQFEMFGEHENWLSRIPAQSSLVIHNSCSSWLSCTLSVCVVSRDQLLTLNRKHLICFGCIIWSDSDSGVSVKKNLRGVTPSKIMVAPFSWLKTFIHKKLSEGTPCKITFVIFTWIA